MVRNVLKLCLASLAVTAMAQVSACAPKAATVTELAGSAVNCQYWFRNADPTKKRYLRCDINGIVVRVDTTGVGQNGGE